MRIFVNLHTFSEQEIAPHGLTVVDVRDLNDGTEDPKRILEKIRLAQTVLIQDGKVGIRCQAGVSRSNGVAVGLLVLHFHIPLGDAVNIVKWRVPRTQINGGFFASLQEAIKLGRREEGLEN